MKTILSSYPLWRESKVINTTDPEELGRIQLKVYPELVDIPDEDCPWCFPHTGGVHGKSFGVPLVGQLVTCVVWNRYFNEITFLPFNITQPTKHLFGEWVKNQRPKITDMETTPEEEHLGVDQFEDDFLVFNDSKNSQHGFLHPSGTFGIINKDGSMYVQSVKKFTFHNKESNLLVELDSLSGDISIKTKGRKTSEITGDVSTDIKSNWRVTIVGNTEIITKGNTRIESSGTMNIKSSGPCKVESSARTTVRGSSMVIVDAPNLRFTGSKSMGRVIPSGSGVCGAISICPVTRLPHIG